MFRKMSRVDFGPDRNALLRINLTILMTKGSSVRHYMLSEQDDWNVREREYFVIVGT